MPVAGPQKGRVRRRKAAADEAAAAPQGGPTPEGAGAIKQRRGGTREWHVAEGLPGDTAPLAGKKRQAPDAAVGQAQPVRSAPAADVGGSGLAALSAQAVMPAGATKVAPKTTRKRTAARSGDSSSGSVGIAVTPRTDPWARFSGFFGAAAMQRVSQQAAAAAAKAARDSGSDDGGGGGRVGQPKGSSMTACTASDPQQQEPQPPQQQEKQPQEQRQGQQQLQLKRAPAQRQRGCESPSGAELAERARSLFAGRALKGRVAVRRLPTGPPLVPTALPPADAKSTAQRLASGLLQGPTGGQRQQPGRARAGAAAVGQRVYVPHLPPLLAFGDDAASARSEARSEALRRMRMRTIRAYDDVLAAALEWQGPPRAYVLDAPSHLPVAVQRGWAATVSADSASGPDNAPRLASVAAEVQRVLGVTLPERALRGERGVLLAMLTARGVAEALAEWVAVCGSVYVRQLVGVEPCVLAARPKALLSSLEALNRHAGLEPDAAVAYVLRHPALVGLTPAELDERLEGLAAAVGLAPDEARRLALERPELLMMTQERLEAAMAAVAGLLPGVEGRLPSMVLRRPLLLLRSPRALARDIKQLAATLGLTAWAGGRLVAGGPAILELSLSTLAARLARIKELCYAHPEWRRQLTAMSPAGLGRSLRCSDAAFERLAMLADAGLAGSRRLPKVKRLLTMPPGRFDALLRGLGLAQGNAASEQEAAGEVVGPDAAAGSGDDSDDEEDSGLLWVPWGDTAHWSARADGGGAGGGENDGGKSARPATAASAAAGSAGTAHIVAGPHAATGERSPVLAGA